MEEAHSRHVVSGKDIGPEFKPPIITRHKTYLGLCPGSIAGNIVNIHYFRQNSIVAETGIGQKILLELGRKRFEDMRWEEMWDASLRIRNMFTNAVMPQNMKQLICDEVNAWFKGKSVAVRSSSLAEDSPGASFAGMQGYMRIYWGKNILEWTKNQKMQAEHTK